MNEDKNFFAGSGEMGKVICTMDWSRTPLGPIENWPQSLRTTVSLCLASNFPISIAWGPQRTQIYNDGYWPICGAKHPHSMGQDFKECWFSAWPVIGEAFERASGGVTAFLENQRMFLDRNGYLEETFFTFSFSPIRDESGGVVGLFHPVTEMTQQSLAERRLKVLRDLADNSADAKTVIDACDVVSQTLAAHDLDVPFVLLYLLDAEGKRATLAGSAGLVPGTPASPSPIDFTAPPEPCWPLAQAARERQILEVEDLEARFGALKCGPYPESPRGAFVLPINVSGVSHPVGFVVAGVSARRALDEAYRTFYVMLREAVTNVLTNARAYEEERKRAEALAELDRAKTAFFSNVSHEFRTPLTLMLGPLEDLLDRTRDLLPAAERERLEVAHRNSMRLLKLVNTLLDFSRIEAGRIQASYVPTDLSTYTAELASVFRSAIERAGMRLLIDCPPVSEPVYIDREMWEKIVLNLLSNAFKFTFQGEIVVALHERERRVQLVVRDTGTGVPAADLPHLFERFYRVKDARGRTFEGSGIGLALVQELVKLHGGTVKVDSKQNQGAAFTVTVPLGCAHLPADRIGAARTLASTGLRGEAFVEEALRWLPDGSHAGVEVKSDVLPQTVPTEASDNTLSARILLADDNADMREYVRRLLKERFEVEAVADGTAALEAARAHPPDLVLTDVMMPGLDGFGLLQALRRDPTLGAIPVIMLSARAGEEARVEGLQAGADDYLIKPFSARELLARVTTHLQLARVRKEATEAVRENEERYRLATRATHDVVWDWNLERDQVVWSESLRASLGYAPEEANGSIEIALRWWLDHIHPDDRDRVKTSFERAVAARSEKWQEEYRFRRADGSYIDISDAGFICFNAQGEAARMVGAMSDITDRKRAEENLRRLAVALAESDRRKDEFLATLSHELRNPLAPLRSSVQLLRQEGDGESENRRHWIYATMERQVNHLVRLVDDLLEMSRISRGVLELRKERIEVEAVVRNALETATPLIDRAGHRLSVALPGETLWLDGDPVRLAQILANLLNNAAKYTEPGGEITVHAEREVDAVSISVRDNGAGISADVLPHIFEMFTRGDRSNARDQGGLGIGLALARRLAEMHGGSLTAHSDGPGRGAEFRVRLPLAVSPCEPAEVAAAKSPDVLSGRILVVDDNRDAAASLGLILELFGAEVRVAHDGHEALKLYAAFDPAVILLDIGMPQMDGYQVAQRIRVDYPNRQTTIVALTGWGQEKDRLRAREVGIDHHLIKPVDAEKLRDFLAGLATRPATESALELTTR